MNEQKKLSSFSMSLIDKNKLGTILDLEKKYFEILWKLFTSNDFIKDLKIIEKEIQKNYSFLQNTWELKNKIKVPAERLVSQYIYKNLASYVEHIYPSAVSSDIAFITYDAIINIDIKTLDTVGNRSDISNLQFENNQSSFINKNLGVDPRYPNSGVKVECLLPVEYSYDGSFAKPMLTYFFTIIYSDNSKSFKLSDDPNIETIFLKCLPNGITSILFDYNLVDNFKTYTYLEKKHGFPPVYLTDTPSDVNNQIINFIKMNSDYKLINGQAKLGAYAEKQIHPKYHTMGVSWFPVSRQLKTDKRIHHFYLEAAYKGNTNRLTNDKIAMRYDSRDNLWFGVKKVKI